MINLGGARHLLARRVECQVLYAVLLSQVSAADSQLYGGVSIRLFQSSLNFH
jgi:hypothetical protein